MGKSNENHMNSKKTYKYTTMQLCNGITNYGINVLAWMTVRNNIQMRFISINEGGLKEKIKEKAAFRINKHEAVRKSHI